MIAFFSTTHGHLAHGTVLTTADLTARHANGQPGSRGRGGSAPRVDNQTVCLHFAALPEVSLRVTKTAVPNPAQAGQPVTFTITISNSGPADAFGVTVDDGLAPLLAGLHLDLHRHRRAEPVLQRVRRGIDRHHVRRHRRGRHHHLPVDRRPPPAQRGQVRNTVRILPPRGTTDHGCDHGCSASVTVSLLPAVPVTG